MGLIDIFNKQLLNKTGAAIDKASEPVESYASLIDTNRLPINARYLGLVVSVINKRDGADGNVTYLPMEFTLVGTRFNRGWKVRSIAPVSTRAALGTMADDYGIPSECFDRGLTCTVAADETNDGKPTAYVLSSSEGETLVWERVAEGAALKVTGDDVETEV